mmetsp:Transcript_41417/g.66551  ORF Transcript_41417/g.66551 Transcript_41417/m.66551 type:complete len:206 (+) Transcript_41417:515-1132(+)
MSFACTVFGFRFFSCSHFTDFAGGCGNLLTLFFGETVLESSSVSFFILLRTAFFVRFGNSFTIASKSCPCFSCSFISTSSSSAGHSLALLRIRDLNLVFTEFSVRPLNCSLISAQRFPVFSCNINNNLSSSGVKGSWLIAGSRFNLHRSRHCFAVRPGILAATDAQLSIFSKATNCFNTLSSSVVHGPLTNPGCNTLFHRCKHCT